MTIIGKTDKGWIIEAHDDEIVHLIGFQYGGNKECPERKLGATIKVADMWNKLYSFSMNADRFSNAKSQLLDVVKTLEEVAPVATT